MFPQEEKSKLYDEALDRARQFSEHPLQENSADIVEYIFPELKESADERIRKDLIAIFKGQIPFTSEEDAKRYIAWLETQEPIDREKVMIGARMDIALSIIDFLDRNTHGMCLSNMECKNLEDAVVDSDWSKVYDYFKKKLEKQGEQNFKVKYAGSEYNVLEVIDSAGITFYGIEDEPNHIDYVMADDCEIISGYTIKDNGSPYPTKTAVFSDQKSVQGIESFEAEHGKYYYCIKDYFCGGRKQASKGDVVQALRGLPIMGLKDASEYFLPVNSIKCNSAWSEDDDKSLDSVLNDLTQGVIPDSDDINWLKSLKDRGTNNIKYVLPQREEGEPLIYYFERCVAKASPSLREMAFDVIKEIKTKHWKPSEDQVEALEYFVRSIGESGYASPYDNNTKLLYSLLEQIKKLRED